MQNYLRFKPQPIASATASAKSLYLRCLCAFSRSEVVECVALGDLSGRPK
jgi:hypothetical protein